MKLAGTKYWVFVAGFSLGLMVAASASVIASRHQDKALDDAALLYTILRQIQSYYVDEVYFDSLVDDAIKAITSNLDPHSAYLDGDAFEHLNAVTTGEYTGIGVEVDLNEDGVRIIAPFKGSPAERAGLQSGDRMLAVNDTLITPENRQQVLKLISGPVGAKVTIRVQRDSLAEPRTITIERETIRLESVESEYIKGTGYISISAFQETTADDVIAALKELTRDRKLNGLVLDLRDNPGGVFSEALNVADIFLDEGVIVTTRGRYQEANVVFFASEGDLLQGKPIVILINNYSASAAEIVAGALQSNNRAILLGEKSFGKGSIQSLFPLPTGKGVMKLTTAHYITPSGSEIDGIGIAPDRIVPSTLVSIPHFAPIINPLPLDEGPELLAGVGSDFQLDEAVKLLQQSEEK